MANLRRPSSPLQPSTPPSFSSPLQQPSTPPPSRSFSQAVAVAEPNLFYLSWGLRLLSDVASHVQRCSMCYAVEEESEHIEGGWSIASPPNGSQRMSIVDNPIYLELTKDYIFFCINCFKQCFGVTLEPPLLDFEEDSIAIKAPHGFITEKVLRKEKDVNKKICTNIESCGEDISFLEAFSFVPNPSYSSDHDSSSEGGRVRVMLVKVNKLYLNNALKELADAASSEEQDKEIAVSEENPPMEMITDEVDAEANEITNAGNSKENVIIRTEKRKRKQSKPLGAQGARCSRINGRGWQCRKTTLPNYALCEYHLGLARTRSHEIKAKNN